MYMFSHAFHKYNYYDRCRNFKIFLYIVVFSNIEVRVKRAGPSGLGDLEVTEYIARIRVRSGPFEREDGASVHLATTEARFMPD